MMKPKNSAINRLLDVAWLALAGETTGEYCAFEYFNVSCRSSPAERIYIRSAQYGRMRVGRCVKVDLGYLGCVADVRHVMEARCSGRRRCSVAVTDAELRTRSPCPTDVTWYLQVSYACVAGQHYFRLAISRCRCLFMLRLHRVDLLLLCRRELVL